MKAMWSPARPETTVRYGSDAIAAVLSQLHVEYAAFNPGSTFRGLHDSFINYRPAPSVIECCHEEISVAIAHGYAKAANKPMVACVHNVVGLQHASMAVFNAWCDRAPVMILGGTGPRDITQRRPGIDWKHTALVQGRLVRDYVKWDDEPANLASVPESLARAYRTAVSLPNGPVYVNIDVLIQEEHVPPGYQVPDVALFGAAPAPAVPTDELERLAAELAEARRPVLLVGQIGRTADALAAVVSLAESLGCPVLDCAKGVGFPSEHQLDCSGANAEVLADADFVLGLNVDDLYGSLHKRAPHHGQPIPLARQARIAHIGLYELSLRSWVTDYHRLVEIDVPLVGDPAVAARDLALLLDGRINNEARDRRAAEAAECHQRVRAEWREVAQAACATSGPIHPAALIHQLGQALSGGDFCVASGSVHGWARRLLDFRRPHHYLGPNGGGGLGYNSGAAIGAALALAGGGEPKVVVDLQPDGDLLFTPSALWTLAKYDLPVLILLDNNRSYFNSQNHARDMAEYRGRPAENWGVGTAIDQPHVDFAGMARAYGVWAEGPVERVADLRPALQRAVERVRSGRPALVDVVTLAQA